MNLQELPPELRGRIEDLGISQPDSWIHEAIPALGGLSIAEVLQRDDGEAVVSEYLDRIENGFPTGYD